MPLYLSQALAVTMYIFGLPDELDFGFAREVLRLFESSCLFVRDSGEENVLA